MQTVLSLWRALDDRFERVESHAWGAVVTDGRFPRIWDVNYARVETDDASVTLATIVGELDPALDRAGAEHRHVVLFHPAELSRVLVESSTRGARITWDAVLVLDERPSSPARDADATVEEVPPDDAFLDVVRRSLAFFDVTDEAAADQLMAIERDVMRPAGKRWFRIVADGDTAAMGSLIVVAGVGLVDHIVTMPFARRRGYADAVVRRLVDEARDAGASTTMLLTDPEGGARRIYERIGFRLLTTIGSTVERR